MLLENKCEKTKLIDLPYQATKWVILGAIFWLTFDLTYSIRLNQNIITERMSLPREKIPKASFRGMMEVPI